jgi:hypothetical protein
MVLNIVAVSTRKSKGTGTFIVVSSKVEKYWYRGPTDWKSLREGSLTTGNSKEESAAAERYPGS